MKGSCKFVIVSLHLIILFVFVSCKKEHSKVIYIFLILDSDDWDDWGAWSPCSVTCGCGQQVRWRHCITEECVKGLKKAQIKTCHLRPCDKGFLSWLGIKL